MKYKQNIKNSSLKFSGGFSIIVGFLMIGIVLLAAGGFLVWKLSRQGKIEVPVIEVPSIEEGIISGEGTVKYIALEGGFYGIVTKGGEKLDPLNLPQEFKKDGLKVKFKAKKKKEAVGIHMWGTIVDIIEIKKLYEIP